MPDVFSKEKRSAVMSRIRSAHTKPEMIVRRFLFLNGFRFRLHKKDLPGKPDIVLKKHRTIILVNGCFWHGHCVPSCKNSKLPKNNADFWLNKIQSNQKRDVITRRKLKKLDWKVLTVWECQLKKKVQDSTLKKILKKLQEPA